MFKFFETLFNFIGSIVEFIKNAYQTVIEVYNMTIDGFGFVQGLYQLVPEFLLPFMTALLAIAVIKLVINLGGS